MDKKRSVFRYCNGRYGKGYVYITFLVEVLARLFLIIPIPEGDKKISLLQKPGYAFSNVPCWDGAIESVCCC